MIIHYTGGGLDLKGIAYFENNNYYEIWNDLYRLLWENFPAVCRQVIRVPAGKKLIKIQKPDKEPMQQTSDFFTRGK